jgi:hypothetical protein
MVIPLLPLPVESFVVRRERVESTGLEGAGSGDVRAEWKVSKNEEEGVW